jgi:dihydrofolate reductase
LTKIVAFESVTLDGVMQAPGRPDEDRRGGFEHGGWAAPYADETSAKLAGEGFADIGSLLLGRRTYEDILAHWNKAGGPFKDMLNQSQKLVASTTLRKPLPWPNSTLIDGDVLEKAADLRNQGGKDVLILGSGALVRSLLAEHLVDEVVLLIHPLVLGSGQRLFDDGGPGATFELTDTRSTTTGVIVAFYRRTDRGPKAASA